MLEESLPNPLKPVTPLQDQTVNTLTEDFLTGDPERYIKQGSDRGVCFHRGPVLREYGGALLS